MAIIEKTCPNCGNQVKVEVDILSATQRDFAAMDALECPHCANQASKPSSSKRSFLGSLFKKKNDLSAEVTKETVSPEALLLDDYSDEDKRYLFKINPMWLEVEKNKRNGQGGNIVSVGVSEEGQELVKRLSDEQLDKLIKIRYMMIEADGTSGEKAIELYEKVSKLAPWDEVSLQSLGVEYYNAGRHKDALQVLNEALKRNPQSEEVRSNLNILKSRLG